MSVDVSEPGTLFEFHGTLYETVGWWNEKVVTIQPVRTENYDKCECGRPLPNQQREYALYSRLLQDGIGKVYKAQEKSNNE